MTASTLIKLPQHMKAVQGINYGDIDEMICVLDQVSTPPRVVDLPHKKKQNNYMMIKVLAVSLAPGDCRVLSGLTRELQGPPSFPYIPGGDCCGIVVDVPDPTKNGAQLPFQIGDRVVSRFVERPMGTLAEYALVSTLVAEKVPDNVSSEDAAALISASPIIDLVRPIKSGERVLVLGASGGIGAHICQMLRIQGASYIVGVSKNRERLIRSPINCDDAIDYTTTDVYSIEKFQKEPFDTIFDFAGGGYKHLEDSMKLGQPPIVKPASMGGRFITTVPQHGPIYEIHSMWKALQIFLFPSLWKAIISRIVTRNKLPKYSFCIAIGEERTPATQVMEHASHGTLKAILDPSGPFPLTTDGVRKAFRLQESRHAHGKVVIRIAEG
jgi:NADPH:quinone reductase-like Zn-dependent oxidoreductase